MKKKIMLVLMGLAIASCGGAEVVAETAPAEVEVTTTVAETTTTIQATTTTTQAPATTVQEVSSELPSSAVRALFISVVRDESYSSFPSTWTVIEDMTDDQMVEIANIGCDLFDLGNTWEELFMQTVLIMDDNGFSDAADIEMVAYLLGAGTMAFCPEHADKIG